MGWLIALGILVAIALIPLGVDASYDCDGFLLDVKIGSLPIHILPKKEKERLKTKADKKTKKQKSPAKKAGKGTHPSQKQKKKGGSWTDFLPLVQVALDFLNAFRQKLRIQRLELKLILAGDDPCDLAVNYGRAWAALGNLMPQLERCFVIKKRNLEVECDFEATQTVVKARVYGNITVVRLLWILIKYAVRGIKEFMNMKKLRKGGASK